MYKVREEYRNYLSSAQGQRTLGNELAQGRKVGAIQNDMAALEAAQDAAKSELRRITSRNQEVRILD